jgi:BirA family biotin operon repressor/biotin-[acetyl-CoA-carboxylase] ligase
VLTPLGFSLLRQLSDGAFHSGEDLAATVGLTRARVSQLLKQAETAGLSLERVRGRGYRLLATPDFLDAGEVRHALESMGVEVAPADARPILLAANDDDIALPALAPPGIPTRPPIVVEIVDQLDSTSTELLRRATRRDIHGALLAAEWQSAGRGRRGRVWSAVAGGSLTFSLGWRYEQGAGFMAGLSLAVGRRDRPRARSRRLGGRRAQVAERPHLSASEGRRHLGRVERRCTGAVDGRCRRRP